MTRRTKTSVTILLGVAVVLLLLGRVFRMSVVIGQSMEPALQTWDYCVSRRVSTYEPRRGDIVTFRTSDDPPLYFIKRVVAVPGETIAIDAGTVLIDGKPLREPYTTPNPAWHLDPVEVPAGKMYVLSDNRREDREDYVQGLVAARLVQSRLLWHWRWKGLFDRLGIRIRPVPADGPLPPEEST